MDVINRLKKFHHTLSRRNATFFKLIASYAVCLSILLLLLYLFAYLFICTPIFIDDFRGKISKKFLCIDFHNGLGNQIFIYAFAYGLARERNINLIINEDNLLIKYFNVRPNTWENYGYNSYSCWCFRKYGDQFHNGYESRFEKLPYKHLSFRGYFQSWRYWIKYDTELREIFQIKKKYIDEASKKLNEILVIKGLTASPNLTLIGVHIRKFTDYETNGIGKSFAPKSYLLNGFNYFKKQYGNCFFLVFANDINWAKELLGHEISEKTTNIYIFEKGRSRIIDFTLLTLTNHTIMTVGTYGWTAAWLSGGTTLYYKHPDKPGSPFSKLYTKYSDHFYPGWIGME